VRRIIVSISIVIIVVVFVVTIVAVDAFVHAVGGLVDHACCLRLRVEKKEFHWAVLHLISL